MAAQSPPKIDSNCCVLNQKRKDLAVSFSRHTFEFQCPRCSFYNSATIGQAKVRDLVICRGCKAVIRLDDYMNECRVALRRIKVALQDFRESVKSLSFDIKLFRRGHHDSNRQINFWFAGK